jgi:hypothetical protein
MCTYIWTSDCGVAVIRVEPFQGMVKLQSFTQGMPLDKLGATLGFGVERLRRTDNMSLENSLRLRTFQHLYSQYRAGCWRCERTSIPRIPAAETPQSAWNSSWRPF